ncbi:hypothetical protein [Coleofasciculus chthonoplastes]|uniref:hypothetical protein n=1 Tax=Coleofasciculus chthonoplastes TaxID=64178 RepID=UPI0032F57EB4
MKLTNLPIRIHITSIFLIILVGSTITIPAEPCTDAWIMLLCLSQFYYPGWIARFKGESNKLPVKPSQPEGLLSLRIPQGQHQIAVTLKAGMEERLGQIISAVCALSLVLLALGFHRFGGRTVE